jgi:uncharacterized membrane protein
MGSVDWLVLFSRAIHLLAAIFAIGGAAFMRFGLHGAIAATLDGKDADRLRSAVRARWARVVHACIVLLLITGGINFYLLALAPKVPPMPYHALFGFKFLAAMGVFFLASALVGGSPGMEAMRRRSARWLSVIVLLGVVIVLLSGVLSQVRSGGAAGSAARAPIAAPAG